MKSNMQKIKKIVKELLKDNEKRMSEKIDKALKSGAIDIDGWDEKNGQYRLPKAVVSALLSDAADSFNGRGTSFEKEQKKDIENIKLFL